MQNIGQESCVYERDELCNIANETKVKQLPQLSGVRPMVDPQAEGNVDPHLYPQPKEATHKIRGKNDIIEYLFGTVDQELLTVKTFYFFFYSAFGSLFPLMGVYFKQMGMNAGQCGLLIGLRPFIEFFSAPFWGSWADRCQKGKVILLASLSCWIIFTLPLGFIQPPATSCFIYKNHSSYLYVPDSDQKVVKRSTDIDKKFPVFQNLRNSEDSTDLEKFQYLHSVNRFNFQLLYKDSHSDRILDYNPGRSKKEIDNEDKIYNRTRSTDNMRIEFEELIKHKRPIDIHQYKRFLKDEEFVKSDNGKPLKKAQNWKKIRSKSIPTKIMIKREISITSLENSENLDLHLEYTDRNQKYNSTRKFAGDYFNNVKRNMNTNDHDSQENIDYTVQTLGKPLMRVSRSPKLQLSLGINPISVNKAVNYKETEHKSWVKPAFSTIVYKLPDIQKTFFLLLLLVIVGEFFAAPAITLADSAVITLLGEDADRYGHQRMFGSLGWGLAMFFVGIALDHSTAFPDHPCGPGPREKNYTICFAIFSVLMGAALITATQINFKYDPILIEPEIKKAPIEITREEQLQNQLSQQLNLPSLQDSSAANTSFKPQPPEGKTKMFAQTTREIPEWITVLKQFKDLKCASFLFVAWFMGFGIGLIFTFLFWHLQDYGGTPTLFGVASVINHISEIFAYFFSFKLIRQMGHVKVLCLGLGGNVLRFLYISWLKNPWWVLPFEFMQGITHAAVWAACCSYIAHNTPTPLRPSAQGVLQGLHHGLGRGCGAVIGGLFVAMYGTTLTFRVYGLICLIVLAAFVFINFYRKDTGFVSDLPQAEDPHQVAEVTHLAPHGVPSNAMPRALSSNRLHELANQESSYGATYQASSTNLNIPGGERASENSSNPFLNSMKSDAFGYTLTSKDSGEYIKISFQAYNEILRRDLDNFKIPPMSAHLHPQQPCTNPFHHHNYDW